MNFQTSMALLQMVYDAGVRLESTPTGTTRVFGATAQQLDFLRFHKDEIREAVMLEESIEAFEAASITVFDKAGKVGFAAGRPLSSEDRLNLAEAFDDLLGKDLDSPHFAGMGPDGRPVYQGTKREWVARWRRPDDGDSHQKGAPAPAVGPPARRKPHTMGVVPLGWTSAESEQWRNIARQILAGELHAGRADGSTIQAWSIGLRGIAAAGDPDARAAMTRLEAVKRSR